MIRPIMPLFILVQDNSIYMSVGHGPSRWFVNIKKDDKRPESEDTENLRVPEGCDA